MDEKLARKLRQISRSVQSQEANILNGMAQGQVINGRAIVIVNGRRIEAIASGAVPYGPCQIYRTDGQWYVKSSIDNRTESVATVIDRKNREQAVEEEDAIALLYRKLSGQSVKILFSRNSSDNTKREYYVGGDREVPTKIYEVANDGNFYEAYLDNTGLGLEDFTFSINGRTANHREITTIDKTGIYTTITPRSNEINVYSDFVRYVGHGQWIGGVFVPGYRIVSGSDPYNPDDPYDPNDPYDADDPYNPDDPYGGGGGKTTYTVIPDPESILFTGGGTLELKYNDNFVRYSVLNFEFTTAIALNFKEWTHLQGNYTYDYSVSSGTSFPELNGGTQTTLLSADIFNNSFTFSRNDLIGVRGGIELPSQYERLSQGIFLAFANTQDTVYYDVTYEAEVVHYPLGTTIAEVVPDDDRTYFVPIERVDANQQTHVKILYTKKTITPKINGSAIENEPVAGFGFANIYTQIKDVAISSNNPYAINITSNTTISGEGLLGGISNINSLYGGITYYQYQDKIAFVSEEAFAVGKNISLLTTVSSADRTPEKQYLLCTGTIVGFSSPTNSYGDSIFPVTLQIDLVSKQEVPFHWKALYIRNELSLVWIEEHQSLSHLFRNVDNTVIDTPFSREIGNFEFLPSAPVNPVPLFSRIQASSNHLCINFTERVFSAVNLSLVNTIKTTDSIAYVDTYSLVQGTEGYEVEANGLQAVFCHNLGLSGVANWQIHSTSYYTPGVLPPVKMGGFSTPFELRQTLADIAIASTYSKTAIIATFKEDKQSDRYNKIVLQQIDKRKKKVVTETIFEYPEAIPNELPWSKDWRKNYTQSYLIEPGPSSDTCSDRFASDPFVQVKGNELYRINPYQLIGEEVVQEGVAIALLSPLTTESEIATLTTAIATSVSEDSVLEFRFVRENETEAIAYCGIFQSADAGETTLEIVPPSESIPTSAAVRVLTNTFKRLVQERNVTATVEVWKLNRTEVSCEVTGNPRKRKIKVKKIESGFSLVGATLLL